MIITTLAEMSEQAQLSDDLKTALEFLKNHGSEKRELGRFEIPDSEIFGFAQCYDTTAESDELRYEAHRNYIDVQYIVSGEEIMKWLPLNELKITKEYEEEGDCLLGVAQDDAYGDIPFQAGQLMILWPSDAHAPGVDSTRGAQQVKKLVVKLPIA